MRRNCSLNHRQRNARWNRTSPHNTRPSHSCSVRPVNPRHISAHTKRNMPRSRPSTRPVRRFTLPSVFSASSFTNAQYDSYTAFPFLDWALLVLKIVQFPFTINHLHRERLLAALSIGLDVQGHLVIVGLLADDVKALDST